jgi:hypothetical protein
LQWGKICDDKKNSPKQTIVKCGMSIKTTEWPTGIQLVEQELELEALKKFKSYILLFHVGIYIFRKIPGNSQ